MIQAMSSKRQRVELSPTELRIAVAIRELRRGSAMQAFRERIYGRDGQALDLVQHDTLEVVVAHGEIRMGDLAAALRIDPSTATRNVARLEEAGLVRRRRRAEDARTVAVAATAHGNALHARLRSRAHEALDELFARFDPGEQRTLADLLERLVAGLDELVSLPPPSISD